jgi:hypothetical protein
MNQMKTTIPANPQIISFNLGGSYNEHGQPCAAAEIEPGLVYFVDTARGLYYYFQCSLEVSAIRHAYLNNRSVHVSLDDYCEESALRSKLEKLAEIAR